MPLVGVGGWVDSLGFVYCFFCRREWGFKSFFWIVINLPTDYKPHGTGTDDRGC